MNMCCFGARWPLLPKSGRLCCVRLKRCVPCRHGRRAERRRRAGSSVLVGIAVLLRARGLPVFMSSGGWLCALCVVVGWISGLPRG